jgi:hypothetical protein
MALLLGLAVASLRAAGVPAQPVPAFVVRLADETIALTRSLAPIPDHATAVALFAQEFLDGFLEPGTQWPGGSGLGYEAMLAGQRLRLEQPARYDEVLRGYGYVPTEAEGTCATGFEASKFTPRREHKPTNPEELMDANWWVSGWSGLTGPPAPRVPGFGKPRVWTCRMTGWLSPRGGYGHMNQYGHQFLVVRSEVILAPDSAP